MNSIKRNLITIILFLISALFLIGCSNSVDCLQDYYKYINNSENGLVKEKNIGVISFSMKYIPTDYFVYKTCQEFPSISKDSIREEYNSSINFILKIAPSKDSDEKFDVMTETVSSLKEFQEQTLTVNFELQKFIRLRIGEQEIAPVLTEVENVYGLTQHRLINIVFAKEELGKSWSQEDKIDLIFNDEIYNTGKHHFLFQKNDIDNVPQLEYK